MTSRAGLVPMSRFRDRLGIEEIIDRTVDTDRGANADYGLGMIFTGIALRVIARCRHLSDLVRLGVDEALMKARSWDSFPVVSAISRVLERFVFRTCVELSETQDRARRKIWDKKRFGRVNLDLDSSAKSAHGHQQGVGMGHNTERSHKPVLNPFFTFIAQTHLRQ